MRFLSRNKTRCYYANPVSVSEILNPDDQITGEYSVQYARPVSVMVNVSAAKGETSTRQFGEDEAYDRTIVSDKNLPITEYTVWWIDRMPVLDENGEHVLDANGYMVSPWDYITRKAARSLNSLTAAVSKVIVNG